MGLRALFMMYGVMFYGLLVVLVVVCLCVFDCLLV